MSVFIYLLRSEIRLFARNRINLFWNLAFPLLLLVIEMSMFGHGSRLGPARVVIVDEAPSVQSQKYVSFLQDALAHQQSVQVNFSTLPVGQQVPNNTDAIITVPAGFSQAMDQQSSVRVNYHLREADTPLGNALGSMLRGMTSSYALSLTTVSPRIIMQGEAVTSIGPSRAHQNGIFIVSGLVVMIILSTSFMGHAVPLVAAREGGLFRRYQLYPVAEGKMLGIWLCGRLIFMVLFSLFLLALACLLYHIPVTIDLFGLSILVLLLAAGSAAFLSLGTLVATFATTLPTATMLANIIYFPLLFTGNLLIPTGGLPPVMQSLMQLMPVNTLVSNVRSLLTGTADATDLIKAIVMMLIIMAISLTIAWRYFNWGSKR